MATGPNLSFLSLPERLRLEDAALRERLWQLICDFRVALPCIVKSFDSVAQTITAQPTVLERLNVNSGGVPVATDVQLPLLLDVPIMVPGGGGFSVTFPILPGDECFVVFADMCINSWWSAGGVNNTQEEKRRHDLSDGFAIFRPRSQPNVIPNYSTTAMEVRNASGTVKISVSASELDITAPKVVITGANEVDVNSSTLVKINGSGHTTIEGKDFLTHKHTGVQAGGANSGPVL